MRVSSITQCPRGRFARLIFNGAVLSVLAFTAAARTIREPDHYFTNFQEPDVEDDFCKGAAIRHILPSSPDSVDFSNGKMHLRITGWGGGYAGAALIAGGTQWEPAEVVVGPGDTLGEPFGVYRDTIATISYTIDNPANRPECEAHSNLVVMVQVRKNRSNDHASTPYGFWNHCYFAIYDGARFALCEYSGNADSAGQYREIAARNVGPVPNGVPIKIRVSALGGSDGVITGNSSDYEQTGQSPAMLEAHIWVNGAIVASLAGQDDPFDWEHGPEDGAEYEKSADWEMGGWVRPAGKGHTDWWNDAFYTRGTFGNRDIAEKGWTGVVFNSNLDVSPANAPFMIVHTYEVVKTLTPPTVLIIR